MLEFLEPVQPRVGPAFASHFGFLREVQPVITMSRKDIFVQHDPATAAAIDAVVPGAVLEILRGDRGENHGASFGSRIRYDPLGRALPRETSASKSLSARDDSKIRRILSAFMPHEYRPRGTSPSMSN